MSRRLTAEQLATAGYLKRVLERRGTEGLTEEDGEDLASLLDGLLGSVAGGRPSDDPTETRDRKRRQRQRERVDEGAPADSVADEASRDVTTVTRDARDARDTGVTSRDRVTTPPNGFPGSFPTPLSTTPSLSPLGLVGRSVGGAPADEPDRAEPTSDDGPPRIVGVVLEPPASIAVRWTVAINRGVTATHGEQLARLRHPGQIEAAERLLAAGVDPEWGYDWLLAEAAKCTRFGIPRSLRAFEERMLAAWQVHAADRAVGDRAPRTPPDIGPRGRGSIDDELAAYEQRLRTSVAVSA